MTTSVELAPRKPDAKSRYATFLSRRASLMPTFAAVRCSAAGAYGPAPSPLPPRFLTGTRSGRTLSNLDKTDSKNKVWQRGPISEPLLVGALETAARFARSEAVWFPESEVVNSPRFFVSFQQITAYHQQIEAVEPDLTVVTLVDVPGEHALAGVFGRGLRELARAGDVAAADVEPVANKTPSRDGTHGTSPFGP